MRRDTIVQIIAATLLLLFLGGAGATAVAVTASVGANRLAVTDIAEEGDPPQVGLGIAMGAFRGFFVNYLWIRANELKEAGRYHEAMNLSRAITTLQPRFPRVWVFHAWNMAYNISVTAGTPQERWEWVNKGVRLLRDEGIPANPNEALLYRELAYIFQHKIQGYTDDSNQYYKRALAAEWTFVLGEPPRPSAELRTTEAMTGAYAEWMRGFVDAPRSLRQAYEAEPAVETLVAELSNIGIDPDFNLLQRYEITEAGMSSIRAERIRASMGERSARLLALMEDTEYAEAWDVLLRTIRRNLLINEYNMDPRRMVRYVRKFGPLDFRHPAAHATYWSHQGAEESTRVVTAQNAEDLDIVNTDRATIHGLQELYRSGEVYFDLLGFTVYGEAERATYLAVPNVHFVDSYGGMLEEAENRGGVFENTARRGWTMNTAGYQNFMEDVVRLYYRRGQRDKAEEWYRKLRTFDKATTNLLEDEYAKPLDEFIADQFEDQRYTDPTVAISEVVSALQGAYVSGLLAGDTELFDSQLEYARRFHAGFTEYHLRSTPAAGGRGRMEVMDRDFVFFAGELLAIFMSQLDLGDAETVYINAPLSLKRYAYVQMEAIYKPQMEQAVEMDVPGAKPFNEVFPEPPGMEQFLEYYRSKLEERASRLRLDRR